MSAGGLAPGVVVGIHDGHNASVAVLRDGKIESDSAP